MASPIDWFNKNSLSKLWAKIDSLFARKTDIRTMIKAGTATNTVDETKSAGSSYFRFMPYTDTENVAYKYIRLNMTGATTSYAGLMSASDKAKLEGIETGATNVTVDSVLSSSSVNPVRNSVINNALAGKIDAPAGGTVGQVLTKTADGEAWQDASETDMSGLLKSDFTGIEKLDANTVDITTLAPGTYLLSSVEQGTDVYNETLFPDDMVHANSSSGYNILNVYGGFSETGIKYLELFINSSYGNTSRYYARTMADGSIFSKDAWNEDRVNLVNVVHDGNTAAAVTGKAVADYVAANAPKPESGMDFESYTLDTIEGVSAVAYRMNDMVTISIHTSSTLGSSVVEQLESSFVLPESFRKKTEFETFYCGVGDFFEAVSDDLMNTAKVSRGLGLRILSDGKIAFRKMPENVNYSGINISIDFTYNRSI